jgi:hypothetical protein
LFAAAAKIYRRLVGDRPARFVPDASRDIFLVTYPRSGTTWISCIAAELMFNVTPRSMTEVHHLVPDIYALPRRASVPFAQQYLIKSHEPLRGSSAYGDYRRVIYLMRDPRDVMLSYHRFAAAVFNYRGDLSAFARDWVCGRIWPGSWQEHINSWLGPCSNPRTFNLDILRYEDFISDPINHSLKLAGLLGVPASRERVANVIADTSPDAMRRRAAAGNPGAPAGFKAVGAATSGSWKKIIGGEHEQAIQVLEEFTADTMRRFGYEPLLSSRYLSPASNENRN